MSTAEKLAASLVPFLNPGSSAAHEPTLLVTYIRTAKCDGFAGTLHPQCFAHARFPGAGATARWIAPSPQAPDKVVLCPVCREEVALRGYLTHPCGVTSRAKAGPSYPSPVKVPREISAPARKGPRRYWEG
jgi:hypothetical protein